MAINETSPGAVALSTKLELFAGLDPAAQRALADLLARPALSVARGQDLLTQGAGRRDGYVILSGDAIGLLGAVTPVATSSVTALGDLSAVPFAPTAVVRAIARSPRLGAALFWAAAREQEILAEHLVSLGRRSARERVAHLFLELWARLRVRGLSDGNQLQVPLTQQIIADALGLSVVHVNRTLRQLAAEGLLTVKRESVSLLDLEQLLRVTGFDEDYLMHHAIPGDLDAELARMQS